MKDNALISTNLEFFLGMCWKPRMRWLDFFPGINRRYWYIRRAKKGSIFPYEKVEKSIDELANIDLKKLAKRKRLYDIRGKLITDEMLNFNHSGLKYGLLNLEHLGYGDSIHNQIPLPTNSLAEIYWNPQQSKLDIPRDAFILRSPKEGPDQEKRKEEQEYQFCNRANAYSWQFDAVSIYESFFRDMLKWGGFKTHTTHASDLTQGVEWGDIATLELRNESNRLEIVQWRQKKGKSKGRVKIKYKTVQRVPFPLDIDEAYSIPLEEAYYAVARTFRSIVKGAPL